MTLRLIEIRDLAYRFVPGTAADPRLYFYGHRSWWPAHEIGHFLIASPAECQQSLFGIDDGIDAKHESPEFRYVIAREVAATSISQRLLRRSGHVTLANEEIEYTDENTLECSFESWCKRAARRLLHANKVERLPSTFKGMSALLARKAREAGTTFYPSRRAAEAARVPRCRDGRHAEDL